MTKGVGTCNKSRQDLLLIRFGFSPSP
jgi:hypothetical protein